MVNPAFLRLLCYLLVFFVFFLPPIDTDLGWHLRYGSFMLENQRLFTPNQLTYFLPDYVWPNSYTLYQLLTTLLFNLGGFIALSASYGVLGVFSFWLFQKLFPKNLFVSLIIYLSVVYFGQVVFNLGWRAQVFSFTFLIATYLVVRQVFTRKTFPRFFPLLFILWANLHGGFVLGLFIQTTALLQALWNKDKKMARVFFLLLVTSGLLTLVNPYGIGVHQEVLNHLQTSLGGIIAEWNPPSFWHIGFILLITPVLLFFSYSKKQNFVFWTILLCMFALMAITAKRNLSVWALGAGICVLEAAKQKLETWSKNPVFQRASAALLVIVSLSIVSANLPRTLDLAFNWSSYCTKGLRVMPCEAVNYIKKYPPEGQNVFSSYEWGGFLEWQLPQYKYFVDGRMPAWLVSPKPGEGGIVPSPYTTHLEIMRAKGNFLQNLENYKTDWLLIPTDNPLDSYLSKNQTVWKEKYRDKVGVIYTKL